MKSKLILCAGAASLIMACSSNKCIDMEVDKFFRGGHELVPIGEDKYYAYISGWIDKAEATDTIKKPDAAKLVRFAWVNSKGEKVLTYLPMSKVRIRSDSTLIDVPICRFRWANSYDFKEANWQDYVIYVVLYLQPNQYKMGL